MSEPSDSLAPSVYQLRIVLQGISPLVWRRLLVPSETTLADFHETVQTSFGWSGESRHRFLVHRREYAADSPPWSSHEARAVRLGDLGLRESERFVYEYDLGDRWIHDVRVERLVGTEPRRHPHCTGRRPARPPQGWGG